MQFIKELFSVNEILTVSIVSWFVAQVLKTIINFILLTMETVNISLTENNYLINCIVC